MLQQALQLGLDMPECCNMLGGILQQQLVADVQG